MCTRRAVAGGLSGPGPRVSLAQTIGTCCHGWHCLLGVSFRGRWDERPREDHPREDHPSRLHRCLDDRGGCLRAPVHGDLGFRLEGAADAPLFQPQPMPPSSSFLRLVFMQSRNMKKAMLPKRKSAGAQRRALAPWRDFVQNQSCGSRL